MPELFQQINCGPNVQHLIESDDCKIMRLNDCSGEGMMTLYHVFPGVFLMYNDFHMKECISGFQSDGDLLCIDHCREGRIEQEVGQDAFSYDFPSTRRSCFRKGAAMSQAWNGTKKESPERRTYTVEDITQILGIGRTSAYLLVKEGHFKIVRIGNAIRISKRSFDEWLESLDL